MWVILLVCVVAASAQNNESLVVNTKQGPVRGYKQPDTNVFAFYGIPYATAPTGRQKFMPPLAPSEREETLEAVKKDIYCMQPFLPYLQEDCLVANVYAPDTNKANMPVMITVHGGGFQISYGSAEGPIAMVNSTDMVAVTFNYRLGAAGFLCLGTNEVPGNAGMKDQVALLRWVQDNIAYFGGNPNDVTIAGCSAGGASVDLLSISPMAEGLFHRVIGGSGSNLATFSVQIDPLENARAFARALNVSRVDDLVALEEFYKTASYETLFSPRDEIGVRPDFSILFSPCVEIDLGSERFLPDAPYNLIRRQNIPRYPMLYGFTDMDGILRIRQFNTWKPLMNERFSDFMPADLQFNSSEEKEQVATKIKQFYFGNEDISESNILSYLQFFTDLMFLYPMLRVVKLHAEFGDNPIYLYEYSFVDNNTEYVPHTEERGAHHCAQTTAVLDENTLNSTKQYLEMKEIMRKLFTNFVTMGVPVPPGSSLPAWSPANAQRSPHMSLGPGPTVQVLGPTAQRRAEFLDGIYAQYYKTPGPPINKAFLLCSGPYFLIVMLTIFFLR